MKGKEKCKALKEIRKKIAEENDIVFAVSECTHQGDCKGTCPKCEAELRYLEKELELRRNIGKAVVVAGISAGICAPMVACNPIEAIGEIVEDIFDGPQQLDGDVEYNPDNDYMGGLIYEPEDLEGYETPSEEEEILEGEETDRPSDIENSSDENDTCD